MQDNCTSVLHRFSKILQKLEKIKLIFERNRGKVITGHNLYLSITITINNIKVNTLQRVPFELLVILRNIFLHC
jgi:hypothetical protein